MSSLPTPHRSPVNFWLLLAATICVDAVVFSWFIAGQLSAPWYATLVLEALIIGELSIVCIWSALGATQTPWARTAPIAAVVFAAWAIATFVNPVVAFSDVFKLYLAYCGLYVALLWLVRCGQIVPISGATVATPDA